ncbi:hypothetical protein BS78_01G288000 [Paspalum vaginatum]|nr:hypothetical protein BS78_01G288000 [Paspalum vaginatum]
MMGAKRCRGRGSRQTAAGDGRHGEQRLATALGTFDASSVYCPQPLGSADSSSCSLNRPTHYCMWKD